MNKKEIKKAASAIIRKYDFSKPTLDGIVYIIRDMGYDIIDYAVNETSESINTLVQKLGVQEYCREGKAFVYTSGEVKILFVCEKMSAEEKLYAIAHELGHIVCSHTGINSSVDEEMQANEFAHYFLSPGVFAVMGLWCRKHKAVPIIAAAVIIAAIAVGIYFNETRYAKYYITESGGKYHSADCFYIRNHEAVDRMTKEQFDSGEYKPCKVCLPD